MEDTHLHVTVLITQRSHVIGWTSEVLPVLWQPYLNSCSYVTGPLTIKHILLERTDFSDVRQKYFSIALMKDLFDNADVHNIIAFIQETHFYHWL